MLGGPQKARDALEFQSKEARWSNGPWDDKAKSLVMLAHVLGGEEKTRQAMDFQSRFARWSNGPWDDLAKAQMVLAQVLSTFEPDPALGLSKQQVVGIVAGTVATLVRVDQEQEEQRRRREEDDRRRREEEARR